MSTIKVVINRCYGGFSVSEAVYEQLGLEWDGYGYLFEWEDYDFHTDGNLRSNPKLIAAIEAVGLEQASGAHANLKIVEVPADVKWSIVEYDGLEHVTEDHRTWC